MTPDPLRDFDPASVLVVDDSRADLRVIELALKPLGLSVRECTDAYGALCGLYEQDFAVALIDVRMPGRDGFALAEEIRRHPRAGGLPILFVTGADLSRSELRRAYALNAVDVVAKPFLPEVLRTKVGVFVELERRRRALELRMELEEMVLATAESAREPVRLANELLRELHGALVAEDDPDTLDLMQSLRGQVARANRLVRGLLQVAHLRLEPGDVEDVELHDAVDAALRWLRNDLDVAGGRLDVGELPRVHANGAQLRLLFRELFGNSIRYRSERPLRIRVDAESAPDEVTVTVEDEGIGIPVERAHRVFDPLRRPPEAGWGAGLGMGLALARRVVHLNRGRIWCEPGTGGVGTRIVFTLPRARDEER